MSKIGNQPIVVNQGVQVLIDDQLVVIKGEKGELKIEVPKILKPEFKEGKIFLVIKDKENKKSQAMQGLYHQLINNAVIGVSKLWEKKLEIVGTGYNCQLKGNDLVLKLGYSHLVTFKAVPGVSFKVEGNNKIIVQGCDKQLVGEVSERIRNLKKPDSYKGKGIRYQGERITLKPTKKVKAESG